MRMFIGQRGNHPTNSKPCPPTTASEDLKSAAGKCSLQSGPQRRREDIVADTKQRVMNAEADKKSPSKDDPRTENAARAEAVAALGMLFSTPRCIEEDVSGPSPEFERISSQRKGSCG